MKRILIDANPVVGNFLPGQHLSGIGRTTMELILALNKLEELPVDISLFSQNMKGIGGRNLDTRFKCHHLYLRNTRAWNRFSAALHLRELLARYDLMHITHNFELVANPGRCIVTLHDAFFMKINEERFDHLKMRQEVPSFIRRCRHVITCSEYSKQDIIETMGVPDDKITVIPWGIDHDNFHEENNRDDARHHLSQNFNITRPYFLSVSCNAERKRTDKLVKAYIDYRAANPLMNNDLVLVWGNPPESLLAEISKADENVTKHIHFLKGVSNDDLRQLYNCATASFTPSAYEGFGLPVLEAMACGCPVVSARNSSLTEVGGDVAVYLDEPIEQSLLSVFDDFEHYAIDCLNLAQRGVARAADFTWERAARATLDVYMSQLK